MKDIYFSRDVRISSNREEMDALILMDMLQKNKLSNIKFNPSLCSSNWIGHFKELFKKQKVDIDVQKEFGEHPLKARPCFK